MECQNAKMIDMSACNLIEEIPDKTFYNCDGISNVKLPTSVTKIGGYAFYDCDALISVSGCDNVIYIGIQPEETVSVGALTQSQVDAIDTKCGATFGANMVKDLVKIALEDAEGGK
jgi:hypothetical protein